MRVVRGGGQSARGPAGLVSPDRRPQPLPDTGGTQFRPERPPYCPHNSVVGGLRVPDLDQHRLWPQCPATRFNSGQKGVVTVRAGVHTR